jgi:hypothetical protein
MATYGYAGDFSSDDDERVEQVQIPAKYDDAIKPNKSQIEEAIESIKRLPYDQDVNLPDDVLAGVLDHYKTQRGPIVDSTRKLYNKIALRLVRGDQSKDHVGAAADVAARETNGNNKTSTTSNNNNNGNDLLGKAAPPPQHSVADAFSSDEDDGVPSRLVKSNARKFDSRVVYNNNNVVEAGDDDQMDVDSETPVGPIRENKPIELDTTDDDDDDDDDDSSKTSGTSDDPDETGEDLNSESDVLEVTPIKPPAKNESREKEALEVLMAMRPSTPKQTESSSIKRQPMAHSTPKEGFVETAKKPYTRSQRIATRSATKSSREMQRADGKSTSSSSADVFIEKKRTSRMNYTAMSVGLLVLVLAFLAYYFRSNLLNVAEPMFRKKISF